MNIEAADVVMGDVIILNAGDSVPADCRVFDQQELLLDESSLTGESVPCHKSRERLHFGELEVVYRKEELLDNHRILHWPS